MLVHCRKQPLSRDGKQRGSVCVNQIHLVTSKSGFRKKLLRVDEHSPSLFIGQGPQLRGGCHRLTLKSVLRADNVYILPAHYPISPSFLTYICLPPAEMAPRTYYLKPHDTGLGLPGFLFLFLLFLKAEIIFFHKVLTTMCKQICASEEVKQTKLSFPYYPQGGAVVLSLTHFRSFKKKEQKTPTFISFLKLFCPHKQKKQILEYLKGRMSVSFQMSLLTSHDSEKNDFSKLQNIWRAMSAVSHVKVPLPQSCTLLHICTPPFEDRLELQRCTHLWCCTLHPCTHHWHNFFHLLIFLIKSHTEFCHWPFNNS